MYWVRSISEGDKRVKPEAGEVDVDVGGGGGVDGIDGG